MVETGLKDRHVIVTGASGGIGSVVVDKFLSEGAFVTAGYYTQEKTLIKIREDFPEHLQTVRVDVRDEDQVKQLFDKASRFHERGDILVANAGIANPVAYVHEMSLTQWQRTIDINLTGTFLSSKYFFHNLQAHQDDAASLVLVGSTAGLFGEAGFCDYAASKAAMHGLMMSLKNEIVNLAPRGRVNLVNPGWTLTPMIEGIEEDKERMAKILQTIPMRKIAQPEDIASTILFLASDKLAGHISGQTITVAGGMEGRVLFGLDETSTKNENSIT